MSQPFDCIVVQDGQKLYRCMWISNWVVKCGKCLRGTLGPAFPKKQACKVCGAILKTKIAEGNDKH